jgi:hypothetical protein
MNGSTLILLSALAVCIPTTMLLVVLARIKRQHIEGSKAKYRGMYGFNDGINERWVDPIQVMMAFESHPEYRPDIHGRLAMQGKKEAVEVLIDAIKKAFGVVEYTSPKLPGLTVNEMLKLWLAFYEWVDFQKKSMQFEQTYAEYTERTSKQSEQETTNSMSGSGSIGNAELQSTP